MKRTTTLFMMITMLIIMMASNLFGQADSNLVSNQRISEEVKRIISLNSFRNPDLVHVGDTVVVYADDLTGSTTIYVVEPWVMVNGSIGKKGCLWKIAETHLQGILNTQTQSATGPIPPTERELTRWVGLTALDWLWLLLVLIAVCLLALYLLKRMDRRNSANDQLDPFRGTPIIRDGLSDNPHTASRQIESARSQVLSTDPNRIVRKVTRGKVERRSGSNDFITKVASGEGWIDAKIPSGTNAYQVQVGRRDKPEDPDRFEYYLSHCGNLVGEIRSRQFNLPEGWTFVADANASERTPVSFIPPQAEESTGSRQPIHSYSLTVTSIEGGGVRIEGGSDRFVTSVETRDGKISAIKF